MTRTNCPNLVSAVRRLLQYTGTLSSVVLCTANVTPLFVHAGANYMTWALVNRLKENLLGAREEVSAMQRQMAEWESTAAAELAASEAALREARQKLRCLEAQQPLTSGAEHPTPRNYFYISSNFGLWE